MNPDPPLPGCVGNTLISTHGEGRSFDLRHFGAQAREGETDIIVSGWSEEDAACMPELLRATAYAVAIELAALLDDLIVAVADPLVFVSGTTPPNIRTFEIKVGRKVPNPSSAATAAVQLVLERASTQLDDVVPASHRFVRAAQRLMKAVAERDPVDQYLEYWLATEIIASRPHSKDVVNDIASLLLDHLGGAIVKRRAILPEALRLKHLEQVRNDIVHGDRDDVDSKDAKLLQAIANELMRAALGHPYAAIRVIDDELAMYSANPGTRQRARKSRGH